MVGAGLQRDIGGGALGGFTARLGVAQGHDLGMGPPAHLGVAEADDPTVRAHQHGAHGGVGRADQLGLRGQGQRLIHRVLWVA